jgi:predicted DsbA family dithiol-disulfide isomerase
MSLATRALIPIMRVEIWSDVVCPWCYVGKRRFDQAVEQFDGDVEVVFRAFELDPTVPEDGEPLEEYLRRKFGGEDAIGSVQRRLDEMAGEVGIDFRWEGKRRANTFGAHQLLAWSLEVAGNEAQARLKERLMRAYFTDNLDVADHGVLARLAGEAGLDATLAADMLATGAQAETVRADERRARELDIYAVPTFVIEGRWAVPGAQDTDTFVQVLNRARERLSSAS